MRNLCGICSGEFRPEIEMEDNLLSTGLPVRKE